MIKSGEFKTCFSRLLEFGSFKVSEGQERAALQYLSGHREGRDTRGGYITEKRKGALATKSLKSIPLSLKIKRVVRCHFESIFITLVVRRPINIKYLILA